MLPPADTSITPETPVTDDTPTDPRTDAIERIKEHLKSKSTSPVLITGPGRRSVLIELSKTVMPAPILGSTGVIDLTTRQPDLTRVLVAIEDSLTRRELGTFTTFRRRLKTYTASTAGRKTTLERGFSTGQTAVAAAVGQIPGGQPAAQLIGSEAASNIANLAVTALQGYGELSEVEDAFVTELRAAATDMKILLIFDGLDAMPEDDSVVQSLVKRVLPRLVSSIAVVASCEKFPKQEIFVGEFASQRVITLGRLPPEAVRGKLIEGGLNDDDLLGELVGVIGGSPDLLDNVLAFQRSTKLRPDNASDREAYIVQARAWTDKGKIYSAQFTVAEPLRRLALLTCALRWVNGPLLESIGDATSTVTSGSAPRDLLQPESRPDWLVADRRGWRIDDQLRISMLTELRRSSPDLVQLVHRAAADHHRRELWRRQRPNETVPDCIYALPYRTSFQQRWDPMSVAHASEWVYHVLSLDPDRAFPSVIEQAITSLVEDDVVSTMALVRLGPEVELTEYQRFALARLGDLAAAQESDRTDTYVRLLSSASAAFPAAGPTRPLLTYELGVVLGNIGSQTAARRQMGLAAESLNHSVESDPRSLRYHTMCEATIGMFLCESSSSAAGLQRLETALDRARRSGDPALLAEVHRLRIRAAMSGRAGLSESAGVCRQALREIDSAAAPLIAAAIRSQLSLILSQQDEPDFGEAEQELRNSLEVYESLSDRDGQIDALAQLTALQWRQQTRNEAIKTRRRLLLICDRPAPAHRALQVYASSTDGAWAVTENRIRCALDVLDHLEEGGGEELSRVDLLRLLALYAQEIGDAEERDRRLADAERAEQVTPAERSTRTGDPSRLTRELILRGAVNVVSLTPGEVAHEQALIAELEATVRPLPTSEGRTWVDLALAQSLVISSEGETARNTWDAVVRALQWGLTDMADEPNLRRFLVICLTKANQEAEAQRTRNELIGNLRRRLDADPADPDTAGVLAACLLDRRRDDPEGLELARRAWQLDNDNDQRLIELSQGLENADRPVEALNTLLDRIRSGTGSVDPTSGVQEPPRIELVDEIARLLSGVLTGDGASRIDWVTRRQLIEAAVPWIKSLACDSRFSRIVADGYAHEVRRRIRPTRHAEALMDRPDSVSTEIHQLGKEEIELAITWYESAAAHNSADADHLLTEAELLLDVGETTFGEDFPPWPLLQRLTEWRDLAPPETVRLALGLRRLGARSTDKKVIERLHERRSGALQLRCDAAANDWLGDDFARPIKVVVGDGLVDHLNPNLRAEAGRLYDEDGMAATLRMMLEAKFGFPVPGITVAGWDAAPGEQDRKIQSNSMRIVLYDAPRTIVTVPRPWATPLGSEEVEERTGAAPAARAALVSDLWLSWITEEQKRCLDDAGETTFDMRGLVCLLLQHELPRYVHELLTAEVVLDRADAPALGPAASNNVELPQFIGRLRERLLRGESLGTLPPAVEEGCNG